MSVICHPHGLEQTPTLTYTRGARKERMRTLPWYHPGSSCLVASSVWAQLEESRVWTRIRMFHTNRINNTNTAHRYLLLWLVLVGCVVRVVPGETNRPVSVYRTGCTKNCWFCPFTLGGCHASGVVCKNTKKKTIVLLAVTVVEGCWRLRLVCVGSWV